jgi:flagellar protein FliO/FliZ
MSSDLVWAMVRVLVALPLVLGLAYLVLKYGIARRYVMTTGNRRMRLVEQLPLGPKATLSLVTLGDAYFLLAHQDGSITLIKELGELPELEDIKIASVVDLKPHTIEEYDLLQEAGNEGETKTIPGILVVKLRTGIKLLSRHSAQARGKVMNRVTNRMGDSEKSEKKVEV